MKFDMRGPCGNCPFLKTRYFPLNRGRRPEIAEGLRNGTFSCHKTTKAGEDGEPIHCDTEQFCGGALVTMAKGQQLWSNQMMRIAVVLQILDPDLPGLKTNAPVYGSLEEFAEDER